MTIETPLWMQGIAGVPGFPARLDRLLIAWMFDEGVMDLSCLKVTQRAAGANFTVDVSVGEAVVQGDDQPDQGNYLVHCTVFETGIVIGAAPGSNSRIDLVGLRINDPNAGGNSGSTATIVVTAGAVAASPVPPATPASTLPLAHVTVASGQPSVQDANIADVRVKAGRRCDPGTIEWTATGAPPNGWLFCYGQAISRTTYSRLFANIGTTYGAGDTTTTFNVPDLRGRMLAALDNMGGSDAGRLGVLANTLGLSAGTETVTLSSTESGIAAHGHGVTDPTHAHFQRVAYGSGGFYVVPQAASTTGNATSQDLVQTSPVATGLTVNNHTGASAAAAHNNMPPYMLMNAMIRT